MSARDPATTGPPAAAHDAAGPGAPLNLAVEVLGRHAADPAARDRPALTFLAAAPGGDDATEVIGRWTYAQAWTRVLEAAGALRAAGLHPGDRVTVWLDHGPDYAFCFFGAVAAGLIPTPASPQLTAEELRVIAADSGARAIVAAPQRRGDAQRIVQPQGVRVLGPADLAGGSAGGSAEGSAKGTAAGSAAGGAVVAATRAEDPAYLIYTSGTGATPKGVVHAHRSIVGRRPMHTAWQGIDGRDRVLHAGTLNWSYTLGVGLMDPWAVGAHAILAAGVDSAGWPAVIARHEVTVFAAVPTVYRQMLKYGDVARLRDSALRHGLCAGEALPAPVGAAWTAQTGRPLYEALGMTEVSTYISSGPDTPVRPGSPGRPQPGRRIAILPAPADDGPDRQAAENAPLPPGEVGLLAVHRSDPGLMLGYWNRPAEERRVLRGAWFTGGDLAALDADGYVWFHGRADDLIKSFGYRLSPVEIEAALATCPGVREVAVVGRPIGDGKTLVTACVVAEAGRDQAGLAARVATHAATHLAGYKRPHEVVLVADLPRTSNGKVRRRALLDRLAAAEGDGEAGSPTPTGG